MGPAVRLCRHYGRPALPVAFSARHTRIDRGWDPAGHINRVRTPTRTEVAVASLETLRQAQDAHRSSGLETVARIQPSIEAEPRRGAGVATCGSSRARSTAVGGFFAFSGGAWDGPSRGNVSVIARDSPDFALCRPCPKAVTMTTWLRSPISAPTLGFLRVSIFGLDDPIQSICALSRSPARESQPPWWRPGSWSLLPPNGRRTRY